MLSGGILSKRMQGETLGSKRGRDVATASGRPIRQPQYGRSGLLARAADEERAMAAEAAQLKKGGGQQQSTSNVSQTVLTKFLPSPFILTPMLVSNSITSSTRRLQMDEVAVLQAQLRMLQSQADDGGTLEEARRCLIERFVSAPIEGADPSAMFDEQSSTAAQAALELFNSLAAEELLRVQKRLASTQQQMRSNASRKEAVSLIPTNYLKGLLQFEHFFTSLATEVTKSGAKLAATLEARQRSLLPVPGPNSDLADNVRPCAKEIAEQEFSQYLKNSVKAIATELTRVELPLTMTVEEVDAAERQHHQATNSPPISERTHTTLTKSIQIVTLKDSKPIEGARPIPALQLIGEKYYEGGHGGAASRARNADPLSAFGFHYDHQDQSALRPKYRFHLLPFRSQGAKQDLKADEVSIDTVEIFGRSPDQATITVEHPSCSGQHFVLFWALTHTKGDVAEAGQPQSVADVQWLMELHVADLGASNGTVLEGGAAPLPLPKAPQDLIRVSHSDVGGADGPTTVLRAACPIQDGALPADVGFGPLATPSYSLMDGDQIIAGLSSRRYVVVFDEKGVVGGQL